MVSVAHMRDHFCRLHSRAASGARTGICVCCPIARPVTAGRVPRGRAWLSSSEVKGGATLQPARCPSAAARAASEGYLRPVANGIAMFPHDRCVAVIARHVRVVGVPPGQIRNSVLGCTLSAIGVAYRVCPALCASCMGARSRRHVAWNWCFQDRCKELFLDNDKQLSDRYEAYYHEARGAVRRRRRGRARRVFRAAWTRHHLRV